MHTLLNLFIDFAEKEGIIEDAFIVGGTVRDIFLGKDLKDIDVATKGDVINIAKKFARQLMASFVILDKEFGIFRVVKDKQFIDICTIRGNTIYDDLSERDITINAIAIPLSEIKSQKFDLISKTIDPHNGINDLKNGVIKMVSKENLIKDPLRILRIFRFASSLKFSIEQNTLNAAKRLAKLLASIAVERIAEELRYMVVLDDSYKTIKTLWDNGILPYVIPELKEECKYQGLTLYKNVEEIMNDLSYFLPSISHLPLPTFKKICLKLSTLFPDPVTAKQSTMRLKMSKQEVDFIHKMAINRNKIIDFYKKIHGIMDETKVIRLLKEFRDDIYPLIILSIAKEPSIAAFCNEISSIYINVFKPRAALLPIITGDDLMRKFNLKPSPMFKKILTEIEDMTLNGQISSKDGALKKVEEILKNLP